MLLLASLIFWAFAIGMGALLLIGIIAIVFECTSFKEAATAAAVFVAVSGLLYAFGWSGHYLASQHVWPWN